MSHSGYNTILGAAFLQGGVEMGYKINDYNGESQTGNFDISKMFYLNFLRTSIVLYIFERQNLTNIRVSLKLTYRANHVLI